MSTPGYMPALKAIQPDAVFPSLPTRLIPRRGLRQKRSEKAYVRAFSSSMGLPLLSSSGTPLRSFCCRFHSANGLPDMVGVRSQPSVLGVREKTIPQEANVIVVHEP